MSVITGTGDKGWTKLWSGESVPKSGPRVESYGTVDELNSFIGAAKHGVKSELVLKALHDIQKDLFRVAGQLASKDKSYVKPLLAGDIKRLDSTTRKLEEELNLKGFVVPGATPASAALDICRSITRRAERRIVALAELETVPEPLSVYMNRLSDLLFILARYEESIEGKIEYMK